MKEGVDHIGVTIVPFLHDGSGKYLLGFRTDKCRDEHNRWEPAGGGVLEHGETMEEAVIREAQEEIKAKPFNIEYLGHQESFREHEGLKSHWIAFYFKAQVDPNKVKIMEPNMCSELRWCTVDEIPEPKHSQFPIFLEKYKDRL